jgi:hypothetical protein
VSASPYDNLAVLPESVTVVFPRYVAGFLQENPYTVTTALVDLELSDYQREDLEFLTGFADGVKVFHSTARALFATAASALPANVATLAALAEQIASDYYLWLQSRAELSLIGYPEWTLSGMDEEAEFVHQVDEESGLGRLYTRLARGPWLEAEGWMGHYAGTVSPEDRVIIPVCDTITNPACNEACFDGFFWRVYNCETGAWVYFCPCFPTASGTGTGSGTGGSSGGGSGAGTPVCGCTECPNGMPPRWDFTIFDAIGVFSAANGSWSLAYSAGCTWTQTRGAVVATLRYDTTTSFWDLRFSNGASFVAYQNARPFSCCGKNVFVLWDWNVVSLAVDGVTDDFMIVPSGPCSPCVDGGSGTIATSCCPSTLLPTTLLATFSNATGACSPCANGETVTLTHNGTSWVGTYTICDADEPSTLAFTCGLSIGWVLNNFGNDCNWTSYTRDSTNCTDFEVVFTITDNAGANCCSGAWDITITLVP